MIQDGGGAAQTFIMGGAEQHNSGHRHDIHGNSMANLITAINGVTARRRCQPSKSTPTADSSSGGMYRAVGELLGNALTITRSLADAYAENKVAANPAGQPVVAGTADRSHAGTSEWDGQHHRRTHRLGQHYQDGADATFTMGGSAYNSSNAAAYGNWDEQSGGKRQHDARTWHAQFQPTAHGG